MSRIARTAKNGFTLVELVIVIAVIAILATIVTLSLIGLQTDTRNNQRSTSVTVLAEALEKYYDENGEYPSCPAVTAAPSAVGQTLDIDATVLKAPRSSTQNSIICNDISAATTADVFAYVGDGSPQCLTGVACLSYTLKYKEEGSNEIKTLSSRRAAVAIVPDTPAVTTVTAAMSGTNAQATTSPSSCNTGTIQYRFSSRVNGGTWNAGAWGTATTLAVAANQGSQYEFRTEARCQSTDGAISGVATSNVANVVRPITAPGAPVVTASATGGGTNDSVTWSWGAVSCPSGTTPEYNTAYFRDDATAWRAWSGVTTATSQVQSTNYQGYEYMVKTRARCKTAYTASNYGAESNAPSFIRVATAPAAPAGFNVIKSTSYPSSGGSFEYARYWWSSVPTCGLGTTRIVQVFGWSNQIFSNGTYAGGGGVGPHVISSSTPNSDLRPIADDMAKWEYQWRFGGTAQLRPDFSDAAATAASTWGPAIYLANPQTQAAALRWYNWYIDSNYPVQVGAYSGGSTLYLRGVAAYARYACINTVTGRYAIGQPGLSGWSQW